MAILRAAATASDTLDATSDTLIVGLTLTPASDDYQLFASIEVQSNAAHSTGSAGRFTVYVGGTIIAHTERDLDEEASLDGDRTTICINAKVSPNGSQAVEIRYRYSSGASPTTAERRELVLFPMPSAGTNYEDSATAKDTIASATFATLNSMTRTPVADDYMLLFTTSVEGNTGADVAQYRVTVGGTPVTHTIRHFEANSSLLDTGRGVMICAKVSPNGSQAVVIQWRRSTGTGTLESAERTMNLVPGGNSDIVEASGTADDADSTTSDVLIDDMTFTDPGDNDWLVIFSSWDSMGTIGDSLTKTYSIRAGGSKVTDSERRNDHEGTLDDTDLPVLAGGRVTVAIATDELEMYWQGSSSDARTIHERTLVAMREAVAGGANPKGPFGMPLHGPFGGPI